MYHAPAYTPNRYDAAELARYRAGQQLKYNVGSQNAPKWVLAKVHRVNNDSIIILYGTDEKMATVLAFRLTEAPAYTVRPA